MSAKLRVTLFQLYKDVQFKQIINDISRWVAQFHFYSVTQQLYSI